jgi:hypothetical protein
MLNLKDQTIKRENMLKKENSSLKKRRINLPPCNTLFIQDITIPFLKYGCSLHLIAQTTEPTIIKANISNNTAQAAQHV